MKKLMCAILAFVLLVSALPVSAAGKKSLGISLNVFGIVYQHVMEALRESPNVKREWDDTENTAQVQLTDTCFIQIWAESRSDSAMITEALHVAAPEDIAQNVEATFSMVATIFAFDPELGIDFIGDLVMEVLPKNGEYISSNCKYQYVKIDNLIMLSIEPRQ